MDPGAAVASPCHEIPSRRAAVILSGIGNLQPPEGRKAVIGDVATIAIGARDHETRSAEHTSELQSLMRISYAVFCLNKKKTHNKNKNTNRNTMESKQA